MCAICAHRGTVTKLRGAHRHCTVIATSRTPPRAPPLGWRGCPFRGAARVSVMCALWAHRGTVTKLRVRSQALHCCCVFPCPFSRALLAVVLRWCEPARAARRARRRSGSGRDATSDALLTRHCNCRGFTPLQTGQRWVGGKRKRWAVGHSVRRARSCLWCSTQCRSAKGTGARRRPRRMLRLPARSSTSQCSCPPVTRLEVSGFGCARQLHSRSLTRHPEPDWSLRSRSAEHDAAPAAAQKWTWGGDRCGKSVHTQARTMLDVAVGTAVAQQ